ncbi:MAG: type I methionyl aminopeptidase [Candidatus Sumerlaeaceae bacterium]|nr:type I methionyl aminopeptidase [Candidatus Sumerlaeaceae bacterium]
MGKRIELKSASEIEKMRKAGALLRQVFNEFEKHIAPGITTAELDKKAEKLIRDAGARPAFLGYNGFPATLCTSINEQVVHGIPNRRALKEGDIVSVDCGLVLGGFFADTAKTYPVGRISAEAEALLKATEESLYVGIEEMKVGNRLGDLSAAIQDHIEARGFAIVRDYTGHGIGRAMHEAPQVPNYGTRGDGRRMEVGLVLAIEPMVNVGTWKTRTLDDDWTVVTADGSLSAHFEHTIAVTADGPLILTA